MKELSVLIGGRAGEGINQSGILLGRLLSNLGYYVCIYVDYPSLIRGGHNFAIVRAAPQKILTVQSRIDYLIALNQDAVDLHTDKLSENSVIIYDADAVKAEGEGVHLQQIIREKGAGSIMRNSVLIGAFAKAAGIEFTLLQEVMRKNIARDTELNLELADQGYLGTREFQKIERLDNDVLPVLTGNETIGLGLVNAGLETYIAYPMTPSSTVLHFLAGNADNFGLQVIHPESEIGVMLMALGAAYAGRRVAVGTSGGGFCLMTEGLSLAGMAEIPVVIVMAQRSGPSTGIPTCNAQADLQFILSAGHGEFVRFVTAPGDLEEAFYWSGAALNFAWKYQIPSIILTDKFLSESAFNFNKNGAGKITMEEPLLWNGEGEYRRYMHTDSGVSMLAFPPDKRAVVKATSYEHDEYGITTEEPQKAARMYDKRMRKEKALLEELDRQEALKVYGKNDAATALLCWGSNKSVCIEVAAAAGLKVIQPVVIAPFPVKQFKEALKGVKKLIGVECNATGQLSRLVGSFGTGVDEMILKYDGRPFTFEELEKRVMEVAK